MRFLVLLTFAIGACGGSEGPCQPRRGLYQVHYEPSGPTTCPALPDQVINANAPGSGTSNCQGGTTFSPDMCDTALDLNCPAPNGQRVITRGAVHWNEDGANANGTVYFEVREPNDGPLLCAGTYRVTYTQL
jgi:hypothetical protein